MVNTPTVVNAGEVLRMVSAMLKTISLVPSLLIWRRVSNFVKDKYGYDTGSWTNFPADESNYKLLFRVDWNITDKHHLAVRYNYTKNRSWQAPNASSMDGGTRASGSRMSQYSMSFANSMYAIRQPRQLLDC